MLHKFGRRRTRKLPERVRVPERVSLLPGLSPWSIIFVFCSLLVKLFLALFVRSHKTPRHFRQLS